MSYLYQREYPDVVPSMTQHPAKTTLSTTTTSGPSTTTTSVATGKFKWFGVNEAGGEFGVVVAAVPGKHWLYHSLETLQVYPETQVVSPLQPVPPHCWYAPDAARAPVIMVLAAIKDFIV